MRKAARSLAIAAVVLGMLVQPASANKNFVPDWTFKGSSLKDFKTLGDAEWRAENGEIIGVPKSPAGGWLILNRMPLEDVQFAANVRCTGGCKAGMMMRTTTTAEGIHGDYFSFPDGDKPAATFELTLDGKGHEISREPLKTGGGMVRVAGSVPTPAPPPRPAGAPRPRFNMGMPPGSPYTKADYSYRPNEWNPLEVVLDANIMRVWFNDGPEAGTTNGQVNDEATGFGPVALYVGGTGEVRFKDVELKDINKRVTPTEVVSNQFRMQKINDYYYGWSATAADINHDGVLDIVSGPFYYLGPDFQTAREIYLSKTSDVTSQLTPAMVNFAWDFTGDGWPDVLISKGRTMTLYVNPKGEPRRWDSYNVLPTVSAEVVAFKDVNGDGTPDAVFVGDGAVGWAGVDKSDPTKPWVMHKVSESGYGVAAQHGIGAGDINGDGKVDIVSPHGWWEQPASGAMTDGPWKYHPVALGRIPRSGGSVGGAEMLVYDVNGDGLNDIVTTLEAHGWGAAWFEQKRDASGAISFTEHIINDDLAAKNNAGGVAFSEQHGATMADMDGDGIPDFVVGKRVYSHQESYVDPDPFGPGVLYWFKTVRDKSAPGGAKFLPELIHNRSGAGSTLLATDLNKDGAVDVITSTNRGTFIFWGTKKTKSR